MKNKKAWLRIVEAFIAVLIIASVLLVLATRPPKQERTDMHELQRHILEQVSLNETLRGEILENNKTNTELFINKTLPYYYNFTIKICEIEEVCGMPFYLEKEIYADEILIASNLTHYEPKKLKLFVWRK